MKELDIDSKEYNHKAIKNNISNAKNELLSSNDYKKYALSDFEKQVLRVYEKYEETLFLNNSLDFDDLLFLPIKLFKENKNILEKYQEEFKYILIDEYQDTNKAQYVLVKLIAEKYKNICVVGDDAQSIYAFRGADYKNILNFEKDYKNVKTILLEQNYRSTEGILNCANDVIKNNKNGKLKKLWTENKEKVLPIYHTSYDEKDEARYVVKEIENF